MSKGFFSKSELRSEDPFAMTAPKCGLCKLHKHCVSPKMPPTGKGRKGILVVAEAPGEKEDEKNTQLIGRAGKRLRRSLTRLGVDLDKDCWKTNAVICRREGNETPTDEMIDACRPNLIKTIKKYKPKVILLLGGVAVKSYLSTIWRKDVGAISRWGGYCIPNLKPNVWVVPTYHPSFVMRKSDSLVDKVFYRHLKLAVRKKKRPWKVVPDYESEIEIILRPAKAARIIRHLIKRGKPTAFDYETNCLKPDGLGGIHKAVANRMLHTPGPEIISCSIGTHDTTIAFPWTGEVIDAMEEYIKSPVPKIASNMKFEDRWTRAFFGRPARMWYWDTMLAAHVLDNRPGITSIKFQAFVWLGAPPWETDVEVYLKSDSKTRFNRIKELDLRDLLLYNGLDSRHEFHVAMKQIAEFKRRKK